jgi:hypothetical protein
MNSVQNEKKTIDFAPHIDYSFNIFSYQHIFANKVSVFLNTLTY